MKFKQRTHTCGELSLADEGKSVTLNGWVSQIRDLGGVIFVNLRDRYGVTQAVFNNDNDNDSDNPFTIAQQLMNEYVISVSGTVQKRSSVNPNMKTGEIEVKSDSIEILNKSEVPPFVVEDNISANEDLRLKYRYLELRSNPLKDNIILRNEVIQVVHEYFHNEGFIEIETPILMKSTPEGARDYLVPSRIHKGKFYALPQSPQTYKQILMIAGFDKYIQLCKCFRDEDLRADRQPEFTQIDIEMSFVTQEDVFKVVEGCMKEIWKRTKGIEVKTPFRRITYEAAIDKYGIDKPDLRYPMEIIDISENVKASGFKVFEEAVSKGETVRGIKVTGDISRKKIDELTESIKKEGFGGISYIKFSGNDFSSPLKKIFSPEKVNEIKTKYDAKDGDIIFILTGERKKVCSSLGKMRIDFASQYYLTAKSEQDSRGKERDVSPSDLRDKFEFVWVTDFPLFTWDEKENRFSPEHHPFTGPKTEHLNLLDSIDKDEVCSIKADCYDLVLNGNELGSGSIRIHNADIQKKVFKIIGLTENEALEKFGFLLEAFKYGAPPHGGAAFGFDRIVALLAGQSYIKEFIAFPKTLQASSLMDDSPSDVSKKQLDELGIKIIT